MTIALFSDIHANLRAFEAFLKDVETRQPDALYCLGVLVGYHIHPNEVINAIRSLPRTVISQCARCPTDRI